MANSKSFFKITYKLLFSNTNTADDINTKKNAIDDYKIVAKGLIKLGLASAIIAIFYFFVHYLSYAEKKAEPLTPLTFEIINNIDTSSKTISQTKLSLDTVHIKTLQDIMKDNGDKNAIDYASAFGDFMAGTALGLWSLGGLLLVYVSFLGQQISLLQAEQQIKETKEDIQETKTKVALQTNALQEMVLALQEQNQKIQSQSYVLSRQTQVLEAQKKAMDNMAAALNMQNQKIENQTDVLSGQTEVLEAQKEALLVSARELTKHSDELSTQSAEMVEQKYNFVLQMVINQFNNYFEKLDSFEFKLRDEFIKKNVYINKIIPHIQHKNMSNVFYLRQILDDESEEKAKKLITHLHSGYEYFCSHFQIKHYFKYIIFILSYIDSSKIEKKDKTHLMHVLMSNISDEELIIWYFEGLNNITFKNHLEKWNLLQNIDWSLFSSCLGSSPIIYIYAANGTFPLNKKYNIFKEIIGYNAFGEEAPPENLTTE